MSDGSQAAERDRRAVAWIAIVLVVATGLVMWPFAPWVLLAVWTAIFARPLHLRLARLLGGRPRIAAGLTVTLLVLLLAPAVALVASLVVDAVDLVRRLMSSDRAQELLRALVSGDGRGRSTDLVGLVMSQGDRAWAIAQQVAGTATRVVIGVLILVSGTYAALVDGDRWYRWLEHEAPIDPRALRRLADAFVETGHGLLVGIVGAGLAQAIVATIIYVAIGVPQPFALGLLTLLFSVVPSIGTALVWVPVAIGLALTDRVGAAGVLVVAGVLLIGTIDNLVRPSLSRRGSLQLPTLVVLVAMFGGIELMGAWGLVVAPLVARLAKEAIMIAGDARRAARAAAS